MTESTQEIEHGCNYTRKLFTIAIDIGGTLAKVVYSPLFSNKLYFHTVETEKIDEFILLLHSIIKRYNKGNYSTTQITATGGGAFKFYDQLENEFSKLSHSIIQLDEMECLIKGVDFFIHEVNDEVFTYNDQDGSQIIDRIDKEKRVYPYMLVNIGSGVSILKVTSPNEFTRVGGSSLGGGTLWGLLSLITGAKTYDQMLNWAQEGDNSQVDMLVGDIYGTGYNKIGLKSSSIASSFGKVFQDRRNNIPGATLSNSNSEVMLHAMDGIDSTLATTSTKDIQDTNKRFKNQDICKSLLYAISNNIGQIAYLQAKIHHVQTIYFGGSYIRGHLTTMNTLSYAINFWSECTKKAFFLKHEGYLGAMGAFLKSSEED